MIINNNNNLSQRIYLSELDGIRSIAILSVLINHLNPKFLPSGYLGVDIFFTLSGFIISYSISNNIVKNKLKFVRDFYLRRFKNISLSNSQSFITFRSGKLSKICIIFLNFFL